MFESLILNNQGLVGHILKRYISKHHGYWDDCFAAGILGLVEAASRYDFEHYSPDKFTNYAGHWIKKEIIDELWGANRRARGEIKLVALTFDVSSARYESCSKVERGRMWSTLIRNILEQLNVNKTQLAALLDTGVERIGKWSNPNSISAPPRPMQIKIFKIVNEYLTAEEFGEDTIKSELS